MIAVLFGMAQDDGAITSLDQSAADFVPAWREDARTGITLHHLLSMTSGLDDTGLALRGVTGDQFMINGAAPLYYELACEWAFPRVAEGLATICVTLVNNLACMIFLILPAAGLKVGNGFNFVVAAACFAAVVGMAKFKENYRRLMVDQGSSIEDVDGDSDDGLGKDSRAELHAEEEADVL